MNVKAESLLITYFNIRLLFPVDPAGVDQAPACIPITVNNCSMSFVCIKPHSGCICISVIEFRVLHYLHIYNKEMYPY